MARLGDALGTAIDRVRYITNKHEEEFLAVGKLLDTTPDFKVTKDGGCVVRDHMGRPMGQITIETDVRETETLIRVNRTFTEEVQGRLARHMAAMCPDMAEFK